MSSYTTFLKAKVPRAQMQGFEIEASEVNPLLKPHQRDMVMWAVRGGRRAIFAAFGLGKTMMQLEIVRIILAHAGGMGLIVIPLGVRQEFFRDAALLGIAVKFVRSIEECDDRFEGIYLTNYETVRDGKLNPDHFIVASLDEAAILRGFGGTKTFREFMALFAGDRKTLNKREQGAGVRYRFVATATPSPNDYIELLAYAAYLGIMDVSAAKTRFFKRDSTKADHLTIHPHKEREFWLWMASWALFVQRPSDLGYSDEGYELPDMDVRWHEVAVSHEGAGHERDGQGRMFKNAAIGVIEASREKRDSMETRVARVMEIIAHGREGPDGRASQEAGVPGIPAEVSAGAIPPDEGADHARAEGGTAGVSESVPAEEAGGLAGAAAGARQEELSRESASVREARSAAAFGEARADAERLSGHARRARRRLRDLHGQLPHSSDVRGSRPRDGDGARDPVRSVQHGAGAVRGQSGPHHGSSGLPDQVIVWCDLNDEQRALERGIAAANLSVSSLDGSMGVEEREARITDWREKRTSVFLTKPSMYGSGVNLQQCHTMIFSGIGFRFSEFIQSIHRIHRFQQTQRCVIHCIYTESERDIRRQLEEKWRQHVAMVETMSAIIREYGLANAGSAHELTRSLGVKRMEASGRDWKMVNEDSVLEASRMEDNSVGLLLTSIPFSTQYEYSPNYADLGHTDNNEHFFAHMDYLTPQLLRVLQPGRIAAIHVKDRVVPGGMTGLGFQVVYPFHAKCIEHYTRHGFAYMGMKTIVTDVVRENNQTYRLGWTEQCKDGTKMGVGMPEYLLLFRKPPSDSVNSYADLPVVKSKEKYSRSRWQVDAHGFMRSAGNRLMSTAEIENLPHDAIFKMFREYSLSEIYDFEKHVAIGEALERKGILPVTFMLLQPQSWSSEVWTDITRMLTLNGAQSAAGREMHLCPMQFDLADRVIEQMSMPGEVVFDPFAGLGTVVVRALRKKRKGYGVELSQRYFADAVNYCDAAAREASMPSLFDAIELLDGAPQDRADVLRNAAGASEPEDSKVGRSTNRGRGGEPVSLSGEDHV